MAGNFNNDEFIEEVNMSAFNTEKISKVFGKITSHMCVLSFHGLQEQSLSWGIIYLSNNLHRFIIILSIPTFRMLLLLGAAPTRQIYIKYKLSKIMLLG